MTAVSGQLEEPEGNAGLGSPQRIVERAFDAFGRRDAEALLELSDPAIEISSVTGILAGREEPYRGQAALLEYLADVERVWDRIELVATEYQDLGGGRILVLGRVRARRAGSEIDTPNAWLWEVRGRKVVSVKIYAEPTVDASWLFR